MNTPYRTLFAGELVQASALTVGGNRPHELADAPLARDGSGRATLRGTALAGSLLATARKLYGDLPIEITGGIARNGVRGSAFRLFNSHPITPTQTAFFQHVGIRQATGAAATDHLHSLEALPRFTRWSFLLEVDTRNGGKEAERIATGALREWLRGRCRLGRGGNHGYGWLKLEGLCAWRLDSRHVDLWPDSTLADHKPAALASHFAKHIEPLKFTELDNLPATHAWYAMDITGFLIVGERDDDFGTGYGVDTLSIGGHARLELDAGWAYAHMPKPKGFDLELEDFNPDFCIATAPDDHGRPTPYIPGAALRGALRHALTRQLRAAAKHVPVRDPCGPGKHEAHDANNLIDTLFGSTERAGALSVGDAYPDGDFRTLWQQHHAEDEFAGGVYGSGKFDRLALVSGKFRLQMRIEGPNLKKLEEVSKPLLDLLHALGGTRQLAVGGGQWRGHGHLGWQLDEPPKIYGYGSKEESV